MISDLQGVADDRQYTLTDPAILSLQTGKYAWCNWHRSWRNGKVIFQAHVQLNIQASKKTHSAGYKGLHSIIRVTSFHGWFKYSWYLNSLQAWTSVIRIRLAQNWGKLQLADTKQNFIVTIINKLNDEVILQKWQTCLLYFTYCYIQHFILRLC